MYCAITILSKFANLLTYNLLICLLIYHLLMFLRMVIIFVHYDIFTYHGTFANVLRMVITFVHYAIFTHHGTFANFVKVKKLKGYISRDKIIRLLS